ncbi:hypothetical protein CAPN001_12510 [Capnocytophaga stomatis]|nr:hypothetical protein CAPN001_12510 [Capnocytophaga stomatis]
MSFKSSCKKGAIFPNRFSHSKFDVLTFSVFPFRAESRYKVFDKLLKFKVYIPKVNIIGITAKKG